MRQQRPAGWYRDPDGGIGERYWDGQDWTAEYRVSRPPRFRSLALAGSKVGAAVLVAVVGVGAFGYAVDRHSRVVDLASSPAGSGLVADSATPTPLTTSAPAGAASAAGTSTQPSTAEPTGGTSVASTGSSTPTVKAKPSSKQPAKAPSDVRPPQATKPGVPAKAATKGAAKGSSTPRTVAKAPSTTPKASAAGDVTVPKVSLPGLGSLDLSSLGKANCLIKGEISRGAKLYYVPGQAGYAFAQVDRPGEQLFCSTQQARKAGFRPA